MVEFLQIVWATWCQLAPWLFLGMFISAVVHVYLPPDFVRRRLRGPSGVVQAVALGVPLPLCSCGVVPAGIGLKKDGASVGASIGFLISTPQTGVDSVLVSASFLGWPFALFKVASAAVTGILGGWLADFRSPPGEHEAREIDRATGHASSGTRGASRSISAAWQHAVEIIESIWRWLVVGIVISAAIELWLPPTMLSRFSDMGIFVSCLAALLVSLPMYVCAVASIPVAASLVASGLPAGAALVFLMAGPATNAATMGAIYKEFGTRSLAIYLITLILGSFASAFFFDWLVTAEAVASFHRHVHEHQPRWWELLSAFALAAVVGWLGWRELRRWRRQRSAGNLAMASEPVRVPVAGLECQACVHRLEDALLQTEGVQSARVVLSPGEAIVSGQVGVETVRQVIEETGFESGTS